MLHVHDASQILTDCAVFYPGGAHAHHPFLLCPNFIDAFADVEFAIVRGLKNMLDDHLVPFSLVLSRNEMLLSKMEVGQVLKGVRILYLHQVLTNDGYVEELKKQLNGASFTCRIEQKRKSRPLFVEVTPTNRGLTLYRQHRRRFLPGTFFLRIGTAPR